MDPSVNVATFVRPRDVAWFKKSSSGRDYTGKTVYMAPVTKPGYTTIPGRGNTGKYGEIRGNTGKYREIQGDTGNYRELQARGKAK
jgi:hypothetical protein